MMQQQAFLARGMIDKARELDGAINARTARIERMREGFKRQQEELISRIDRETIPVLESLGKKKDNLAFRPFKDFLDLFLFDVKNEIPELRAASSFTDMPCWRRAADSLGQLGDNLGQEGVVELKRMLGSTRPSVRYAAAHALGLIGPKVDTYDRTIVNELNSQLQRVTKSSEDRAEKDRRIRILQDAIVSIRPNK
jgi:HEAT repeat protein